MTAILGFDVNDTGCGISEGDVARLFTPFTQADASTSRRFGGSGLGLTISRHLAQMLGGDISLTSCPGEGSRFRLTVETGPLEDVKLCNEPAQPFCRDRHDERGSGRRNVQLASRILLVEDGLDNQRLISRVLERAGATVAIVENGEEACRAALAAVAEGNSYDVVLMDMQMPVMDGYQATRALRQAKYEGIIIALTANAMVGDDRRCLAAGCDA